MDVMQLRRNLLMQRVSGGLPAEYQQIEWIQSTGTQYIATNYVPGNNLKVNLKYSFASQLPNDKNDELFFGARDDSSERIWVEVYLQTRCYCANGYSGYRNVLNGVGLSLNTVHSIYMDNEIMSVDNNTVSKTTDYSNPDLPIHIFGWNHNGTHDYTSSVLRIHELKFSEGNNISANFVPCVRKADGEPGMYDTVSKTFYTNAGTGEFIIPDSTN